MSNYPKVILKPGKDEPVKRFHPWIFSGAIRETNRSIEEGDIVEVFSSNGDYLATGQAQRSSIAVKIISFKQREIDREFWREKLEAAYYFRKRMGLTDKPEINAYRLVFGEGDNLPGLVIDYLNGSLVIQCHSVGMHLIRQELVEVLKDMYGDTLISVYDRSAESLAKNCGFDALDGYLYGDVLPQTIRENGLNFHLDILTGQKTGYFLDQRKNREIMEKYVQGRKVLDLFCYSGSFSIHALRAGADVVHAVDSSKLAIGLAEKNLQLNTMNADHCRLIVADAKAYLDGMDEEYDVIILDPPAFAKHHSNKQQAVKGYRSINAQAIKKIGKQGILFTFSCSQAIDRSLFETAILSAAIDAGRQVKIVERLTQPADHPVNIFHPEGEYLKGLVLYVD